MKLRGKTYTQGNATDEPAAGSFVVCQGKVWKVDGFVCGTWVLLRGGHALYNDEGFPMYEAVEEVV